MGGPDNLRGVDYQISYVVWRLLRIIKADEQTVQAVQFESGTEDEEDLTLVHVDGTTTGIQIKKRTEGYAWNPSTLAPVFAQFSAKDAPGASFVFASDRGVNLDVAKLKTALRDRTPIDGDLLGRFTTGGLDGQRLQDLLQRVTIESDCFASPDTSDPARTLREQIHALLRSPPFSPVLAVDEVAVSLWKLVFAWSRRVERISIEDVLRAFEDAGAVVDSVDIVTPFDGSGFVGRASELDDLERLGRLRRPVVLRGISGTGKTELVRRYVARLQQNGERVFYWMLDPLVSPSTLRQRLVRFLCSIGTDDPSLRSDNLSRVASRISAAFRNAPATVVLDAVDRATGPTSDFVQAILAGLLAEKDLGATFVVTTAQELSCYSRFDLHLGRLSEYLLTGFSEGDSLAALQEYGVALPSDAAAAFHVAVGGFPIAYVLLKGLRDRPPSAGDVQSLSAAGVEGAKHWLIDRVLGGLAPYDRTVVHAVSVFESAFTVSEADAVVGQTMSSVLALEGLARRGLCLRSGQDFVMHDLLRMAAFELNSAAGKRDLWARCASHYFEEMSGRRDGEGDGIPLALLAKWGRSTERAVGYPCQTPAIRALLDRSDTELEILWAVHQYGYPFSFVRNDEESVTAVLERLEGAGLIRNLDINEEAANLRSAKFRLNEDGLDSVLFLSFLNRSRDRYAALGYVPKLTPNENWREQDLTCQWEHCIELMPCPPIARADHEEHIRWISEGLATGRYVDKSPEDLAFLEYMVAKGVPADAPEVVSAEDLAKACPIFGHYCPGGVTQADLCRQELADDQSPVTDSDDGDEETV